MGDEAGGFWAMGLDAHKGPIETATTNPGHALWAGLLRGHRRAAAARACWPTTCWRLGLRTLSSPAAQLHPLSYHNGASGRMTRLGCAGHEARRRRRGGMRGGQSDLRGRFALPRRSAARAVVRLRPRPRPVRLRPSTRSAAARKHGRREAHSCCCRHCWGSRPTPATAVWAAAAAPPAARFPVAASRSVRLCAGGGPTDPFEIRGMPPAVDVIDGAGLIATTRWFVGGEGPVKVPTSGAPEPQPPGGQRRVRARLRS